MASSNINHFVCKYQMSDHRKPPLPPHYETAPEGTCRWCNVPIGLTKTGKPSKSRWHPICVKEYKFLFWPAATRREVWKRDKGKCNSCGIVCEKKGPLGWDLDHITPLIEGTGDLSFWQMGNLQTLCKPCHKEKTSREATERAAKRREAKKSE